MKGSIIIILTTLLTQQGWASKARVNALQNSPTITDERDILNNPAWAESFNGFFSLEAGAAGSTLTSTEYTAPKAEGGFSRTMGESRMGAHIGKAYNTETSHRVAGTFLGVKNPIDLHYAFKMGDGAMGVGLGYSKSDEKTAGKQSYLGLNVGYVAPTFNVGLKTAAMDTAESETVGKYNGSMPITVIGNMMFGELQLNAEIDMLGYKIEDTAGNETAKHSTSNIMVGLYDKKEVEGGQFFYGGSINNTYDKESVADSKVTKQFIKFLAGVEATATSWLDLRGAVSQNVLIDKSKTQPADEVTGDNSTLVSGGASVKFGKLRVDASLASAVSGTTTYGQVNGNSLLGDMALTYSF